MSGAKTMHPVIRCELALGDVSLCIGVRCVRVHSCERAEGPKPCMHAPLQNACRSDPSGPKATDEPQLFRNKKQLSKKDAHKTPTQLSAPWAPPPHRATCACCSAWIPTCPAGRPPAPSPGRRGRRGGGGWRPAAAAAGRHGGTPAGSRCDCQTCRRGWGPAAGAPPPVVVPCALRTRPHQVGCAPGRWGRRLAAGRSPVGAAAGWGCGAGAAARLAGGCQCGSAAAAAAAAGQVGMAGGCPCALDAAEQEALQPRAVASRHRRRHRRRHCN